MRIAVIAVLLVLALTRAASADFHALRGAAQTNDVDAARRLLEQGVNPNAPRHFELDTPLLIAARRGHADITRLLLEHGAETEYRNRYGDRALLEAANLAYMNHYTDPAGTIELLLEAGSPPDSDGDGYGTSPLIKTTRYGGKPEIVHLLLAAGADANRADNSGETALYGAVRGRDAETARLLLEAGAEPNIRVDHLGQTPLHRAALFGVAETIRLLVEAGAEIEARQADGETPLFVAAGRGYPENVAVLVSLGAQVDARAASGLTPVLAAITGRYATDGSHADAALYLAGHTADMDRAFAAALWHEMPIVAGRLLERGADIDAVSHTGRSALAAAAAVQPGLDWLERLAALGADIARHGGEALREAAARGRDDSVVRLIELGVPVADARPGAHALAAAAVGGRVPTVVLLMERGARLATVQGLDRAALDSMIDARRELETVIAHAEASRAWIDVSAERAELARLEAAHAEISVLLGL